LCAVRWIAKTRTPLVLGAVRVDAD